MSGAVRRLVPLLAVVLAWATPAPTQPTRAAPTDERLATRLGLHLVSPSPVHAGTRIRVDGVLTRRDDQGPVDGRAVPVAFNGRPVGTLATAPNGRFSVTIDVPRDAPVDSVVQAHFAGDQRYRPSAHVRLHVKVVPPKQQAYLQWNGARGRVGETVTLTARLGTRNPPGPDNGVGGKTVRFWRERDGRWAPPHVGPKPLGTATTNAQGEASLRVKLDDRPLGYSLYAAVPLPDDDITVERLGGPTLTVDKAPVTVVITGPAAARIGDTLQMKVRVTRATDGAPAAGVRVSGNATTGTTGDGGEIAFTYQVGSAGGIGPRTLQVQSQASDWYLAGHGSKTIQVGPKTN
jgi:hypothetical protein